MDPFLEHSQCFNCHKKIEKWKRCARCKLVYYCSQNCQKAAFPDHKEFCKQFSKLHKTMQKEEKNLRKNGYFDDQHIGHFWRNMETRKYCASRNALASHVLIEARSKEIKPMYQSALNHYLELLRLCYGDNLGVRDEAVFILLRLGRIEDTYNFIKWWMLIDLDGTYDWNKPPKSKECDWLYLKNQDIYEDLLEILQQKGSKNVLDLNFLIALYLIKMQILNNICVIDIGMNCVRDFLQSKYELNNENRIERTISLYLAGGDKEYISNIISTQFDHAKKYLDMMMKRNEIFLKCLINPWPMTKCPLPSGYMVGSQAEAHLVMKRCRKLLMQITNAGYFIEERVGKNPQYEYNPFSCNFSALGL